MEASVDYIMKVRRSRNLVYNWQLHTEILSYLVVIYMCMYFDSLTSLYSS